MDLSEISRAITRGLSPLRAPPALRLSQWAAEHFYLSAESSYTEGRWRAWPFQHAILDCMGNDWIRKVTIIKSARVGYSKMFLACVGYNAQHRRRNQGIWNPTDEDSDDFCKTDLEPMLRDVAIMARLFPANRARDKRNTLRTKMLVGCSIHMRGGKAAKNYRRLSIDVGYIDEVEGFDANVQNEGSPIKLVEKRTEGATWPKLIVGSTPKRKGESLIEGHADQADLYFQFHIPCPHCGHEHTLEWGSRDTAHGMKWTDNDPRTVAQLCPSCGTLYTQAEYLSVWDRGRYIATRGQRGDMLGTWIDSEGRFRSPDGRLVPPVEHVAFHIWTAYSRAAKWVDLVREFLEAVDLALAGDTTNLQTFTNLTLGRTWEPRIERTDAKTLQKRAEPYPLRTVPRRGLVLTAGVDVQDNRFEIAVWAYGRGLEMWTVDYMVLAANPGDPADWEKLDQYLQTRFAHEGGQRLSIEAVAIDTGGHFTHEVYEFCRTRAHRRVFAVKGEERPGRPIVGTSALQDINWNGRIIKSGVRLWRVGTDTAKDLFSGRLGVLRPGPGYVHFCADLEESFYEGLTAEARVPVRTARGVVYRWTKVSSQSRNEPLDTTVYALFAAHRLDLHRYTEIMWTRIDMVLNPLNADLFAARLDDLPALPPPVVQSPSESRPETLDESPEDDHQEPELATADAGPPVDFMALLNQVRRDRRARG